MLQKICHGGQRGIVDHAVVDLLENTVNTVQPLRDSHIGIINRLQVSDKSLEKVVVRIDQAWIDEMAGCVDDLIALCG